MFQIFSQEVIAFQQDQSPDVRKFVVEFMEDAWYDNIFHVHHTYVQQISVKLDILL